MFLKAFSEHYPRVNVDLTVDISLNLRAALLERRLDLAFLMGPVSEFSVENIALPPFDLHWYRSTANDRDRSDAGAGDFLCQQDPALSGADVGTVAPRGAEGAGVYLGVAVGEPEDDRGGDGRGALSPRAGQ